MLPQQRDGNLLIFLYKYDTDIDFFYSTSHPITIQTSNLSAFEPCFEVQHRIMWSQVQDILAILEMCHTEWMTAYCSGFV